MDPIAALWESSLSKTNSCGTICACVEDVRKITSAPSCSGTGAPPDRRRIRYSPAGIQVFLMTIPIRFPSSLRLRQWMSPAAPANTVEVVSRIRRRNAQDRADVTRDPITAALRACHRESYQHRLHVANSLHSTSTRLRHGVTFRTWFK